MKPFAWSWSKLKNFRSCPKRHWHMDIQKDFAEPESDHMKWGHMVHQSMADFIRTDKPLPLTMEHFRPMPERFAVLRKEGVPVDVELKLAMNEAFKPVGFFDNGAWFRGVVDVMARGIFVAHAADWKTGKMPDGGDAEYEQLALTAQLVFAHYPEIDEVSTSFVWLGYFDDNGRPETTERIYTRDGMMPLWNKLWPDINVMKEAWRTTTYPPKPSGLCRNYCAVTSCPFHGKGNR